MKKHLAALAVAALACGAFAQAGDTIGKVKASGAITMGVRDASGALSYALGGGKYGGFHYEVCQRIIASLEAAIGRKVEVRFQAVTPQDRIVLMQEGVVDIECGSTTNTAARQKDVSFALTTYVDEVRIAVKADSGITSIAQLDGKTVAATAGTLSVPLLRKLERVHRIRFKEVFGKDHADSFLLLASGRADAFLTGTQTLAGNIANARNPSRYRILDDALGVEPVAIMLPKDDPAFKKLADDTIRNLIGTGELARIHDKWFMQPIPPKNARLGLPPNEATQAAWAHPNDRPAEDYAGK